MFTEDFRMKVTLISIPGITLLTSVALAGENTDELNSCWSFLEPALTVSSSDVTVEVNGTWITWKEGVAYSYNDGTPYLMEFYYACGEPEEPPLL